MSVTAARGNGAAFLIKSLREMLVTTTVVVGVEAGDAAERRDKRRYRRC